MFVCVWGVWLYVDVCGVVSVWDGMFERLYVFV